MEQSKNPFIISGYVCPEYFCDREKETQKLISALENGRNVSLISPRRYGKTGLIQHTFYKIKEQKNDIFCFYLDIFATQNLHDFTLLFGQTVLEKLDDFSETAIKKITSFFKNFRPLFSFDPVTCEPYISFDIKPEHADASLREIFDYIKQSGKRCYIAIDEFQQITEYPEKGTEALLRSHIQFLTNVNFIFAGSKKHIMDTMFSAANRPFYQSTQKMNLQKIPLETYCNFAQKHFENKNKTLNIEIFEKIYALVSGHTWYIQSILNNLFVITENATEQDVETVVNNALEEENSTYKTYCDLLTKGQLNVLSAIAKERGIAAVTSTDFIKKYNLSAASSVKIAVKALINKSLVLKSDDGNYFVYDRYFGLWLERNIK
ncbi:MAG: ATP-binding protein [Prevotellaceae bacterium]|jgi:hypothetical protein|nr:ATP-binding protein [Prevotellaceae bacterium]